MYEAEADNEYVIRGNSAIMKCEIPSFVADFVFVDSWEDSEGKTYIYNNMSYSGRTNSSVGMFNRKNMFRFPP